MAAHIGRVLRQRLHFSGQFSALAFNLSRPTCVPVYQSQQRQLHLQEYASKQLMDNNGINIQRFRVAENPQQATAAASELLGSIADELVIKAQILAGGRGKGVFDNGFKGGVQFSKDPEEVGNIASQMLGYKLATKQTPPEGVMVKKITVAECLDIARETYLAILLDREHAGPVVVACAEGGVDIEDVAEKTPEAILTEPVDIHTGLTEAQAEKVARHLQFDAEKLPEAKRQIQRLYELFVKVDATQVEINPFAETPDGRVVCFDAKINFDDNAFFRQEEIFAMDDLSETDPREVEASKHGLSYVPMDGEIGCLVNGAGLAMATMDIIKLHGMDPANFLDFGGQVTEDRVFEGFKILTGDSHVKAILVNIFGGIVDCAIIARGVENAAKKIGLNVPMVVRLEGTNVGEARQILRHSGLPLVLADDFEEAAAKACEAARQ